MSPAPEVTRRDFVRVTAAAGVGLTLAFYLPGCGPSERDGAAAAAGDGSFEPNAFLRIDTDGSVTVVSKHLEMGQGSYTGLATIVAEELDADWSRVRVLGAPADAKRYNNLSWGPAQGTGGSSSIANSYEQLRKAGATARAMLVAAAAAEWGVPAGEIEVENGVVTHGASGHRSGFGDLVARATTIACRSHLCTFMRWLHRERLHPVPSRSGRRPSRAGDHRERSARRRGTTRGRGTRAARRAGARSSRPRRAA